MRHKNNEVLVTFVGFDVQNFEVKMIEAHNKFCKSTKMETEYEYGLYFKYNIEDLSVEYTDLMDANEAQRREVAEYINLKLSGYQQAQELLPVNAENCLEAIHDGVLLTYLFNFMSTDKPVINESLLKKSKPTLFHKLDQVNKALEGAKAIGLNLVNARAESIVEMKENIVLGMFNQIIRQKPQVGVEKPKIIINKSEIGGDKSEIRSEEVEERGREEQTKIRQSNSEKYYEEEKVEREREEMENKVGVISIDEPINEIKSCSISSEPSPLSSAINQNQYIPDSAVEGYQMGEVNGRQVLVLIGSLRKTSVHRSLINKIEEIKNGINYERIHFHIPDLNALPLFNGDLESRGCNHFHNLEIPKSVYDLQELARRSSAVLIATPEYNSSFSGIIKNAIDWLYRSYTGEKVSPLEKKKVGIMSSSFLTQIQINDTIEMMQTFNCLIFGEHFYAGLGNGDFNMATGELVGQKISDKLEFWYQGFSNFVLGDELNPEPIARFVLDN